MESYEVVNCYTFKNETGECRDVVYRMLDRDAAMERLRSMAEALGVTLAEGEIWFGSPSSVFEENYYMVETVEIDE